MEALEMNGNGSWEANSPTRKESETTTVKQMKHHSHFPCSRMNEFDERNNSCNKADEIRMLGCWIGAKADVQKRKKRANGLWAQVRSRLKGSQLSKKQQAKIVEACVESGILFDAATRSWTISDHQATTIQYGPLLQLHLE